MNASDHPDNPTQLTNEIMAFCAVAKFQSFSQAAQFLNIGQPTVTDRVHRLELVMGTALFNRSRRPVQLTPTGVRLSTQALPVFDSFSVLARRITRNEIKETVRVGATSGLVDYLLPDVLRRFRDEYSDAEVHLRSQTITEVVDSVRRREADIGILPSELTMTGLDFVPLVKYPWKLIAPIGHPVLQSEKPSIRELSEWPIIVPRQSVSRVAWITLFERMQSLALQPEVLRLEVVQSASIKKYVRAGLGISFIPAYALESADHQLLGSRGMDHEFEHETIGYIRPTEFESASLVERFTEVLRSPAGYRSGFIPISS